MAIQPFATQIQPPQIAAPSPANQMAQLMALRDAQQQNQLRQMQMATIQREEADINALRQFDPSSPTYIQDVTRLNPELGSTLAKNRVAMARDVTGQAVEQQNLVAKALDNMSQVYQRFSGTTDNLLSIHNAVHSDPILGTYLNRMGVPPEPGAQQIEATRNNPKALRALLVRMSNSASQLAQHERDLAAEGRAQAAEGRAKAGEGRAQAAEGRAKAKESREAAAANLGTYNAEAGGFISSTTGKFTPLTEVQQRSDVRRATKALETVGYDSATSTDRMSDLIKGSTGSQLGAMVDWLSGTVGVSTPGAQNIAAISTLANTLTLDLLDGKLGAGISTTDREFVEKRLGDVSNPTIPAETRLKAWTEALDMLKRRANVQSPRAKKGASGAWADDAVDTSNPLLK
jgi:hypothetical protein